MGGPAVVSILGIGFGSILLGLVFPRAGQVGVSMVAAAKEPVAQIGVELVSEAVDRPKPYIFRVAPGPRLVARNGVVYWGGNGLHPETLEPQPQVVAIDAGRG